MARSVACLRYFLLGYAIVLGISGLVVAAGSSFFVYQLNQYHSLTPENVSGPAITLLVMGLVTCLISWCGWRIIEFTHRVQVLCFAVLLGVIAFTETGIGIWAVIKHEQIDTLRTAALETVFALAITDEKAAWDQMQIRLSCCGIDGPADYRIMDSVPWSCCDTISSADPNAATGACTKMWTRGCLHPVINRTRSILLHVFLLALCSVVLQVCGVITACFFARSIKKSSERRRQEMSNMIGSNSGQTLPRTVPDAEADSRLVRKAPALPSRRKT